jgi:hypothetical protein
MSTVPAILVSALVAMMTSVFLMDWVVVDVRTAAPENMHFKVPFPLCVADIASEFIPREALDEAEIPPEVRQYKETVIEALSTLLDAPDATFVRVDTDDAHVVVAKQGDDIVVDVDADDAIVHCTIPLDGVLDALENWDWQSFDPDLVFDVLAAAGNGNLVTVEAEGTRVAVNMW